MVSSDFKKTSNKNKFTYLIFRLEAYDRNQNFGAAPDEPLYTWSMHVPNPASYMDITPGSFIPLSAGETTAYLDIYEVQLGNKSRQLYTERYKSILTILYKIRPQISLMELKYGRRRMKLGVKCGYLF